jgi:putative PIN family toxin of toxin-antitoxin system
MKIVLDTNVLISALLSPKGPPARIMDGILNGKYTLQLDNRILLEYMDVIRRPEFAFKEEWISPLIDYIRMESDFISAEQIPWDLPDRDDCMFYEVALASSAKALITGNKKHFPECPLIMSPSEFLESLEV